MPSIGRIISYKIIRIINLRFKPSVNSWKINVLKL